MSTRSVEIRLKAKSRSPCTVKQSSLPEGRIILKCGSSPPPIATVSACVGAYVITLIIKRLH